MSRLKIGFIMDPIETIRTHEDSTYLFMLESQRRDHTIYYMTVPDLYLAGRTPMAEAYPIEVFRGDEYYRLGEKTALPLDDLDVLFMRKDPPFDINYYTATLILDQVHRKTLVINDSRGLRDNNEKGCTLQFPELIPETIVTRRIALLQEFLRDRGGEMIVKPLFRSYGRDILYVQENNINCNTLLEIITKEESCFVMAQRYLHEAMEGDKRIILLDGEPIGAVLWLPPEGSGDKPPIRTPWNEAKIDLSERDLEICETIRPYLQENGLYFAGIDVIGGYLTEINITSPTCLPEINRLNNDCLEAKVIDFAEEQWAKRRL
jgi:glutathione synthase